MKVATAQRALAQAVTSVNSVTPWLAKEASVAFFELAHAVRRAYDEYLLAVRFGCGGGAPLFLS